MCNLGNHTEVFQMCYQDVLVFYFSYQRRSAVHHVALILRYYKDYSLKVTEPSNQNVVTV